MEIEIRDHHALAKLMRVLAGELADAQIHFKMFKQLVEASQGEYCKAVSQAQTFWSLTFQAHLDATLLRLCKTYDNHQRSLNLRNLLLTIQAHRDFFDEGPFRERLKNNPHVDNLCENMRVIDDVQLLKDIENVSEDTNPKVKNLMLWRHKFYAHRDPHKILSGQVLGDDFPLTYGDIEILLKNGVDVINRYTVIYMAESFPAWIVGGDDYLQVLKVLQRHVETYEASLSEEIKRYSGMADSEPTHVEEESGSTLDIARN